MDELRFLFNGIHGSTGNYLQPPLAPAEVAYAARKEDRFELQRKNERNGSQCKGLPEWVEARDLSEAGWGIIFPAGAPSERRESLALLLEHRRRQATGKKDSLYREFLNESGYRPGESKIDFIERHLNDEKSLLDGGRLPYYLLLAGSPEEIPYSFQYQLGVHFAVGRLDLPDSDAYARYAKNVVSTEKHARVPGRPRLTFFCPSNGSEPAIEMARRELAEPLIRRFTERDTGWTIDGVWGKEATRDRLAILVAGAETPDVLFTLSHGLGYRAGRAPQEKRQGALICEDWPGLGNPVQFDEHCLGAEHLTTDLETPGLIAFHFACHSAGTPRESDFHLANPRVRSSSALRPFTARLPQELLTRGALAVIGHIDIAWQWSFRWREAGQQCGAFENALARLMSGQRVGHAMQYFNRRYAALATDLDVEICRYEGNDKRVSELFVARNDARNYVVLGDPATRVVTIPGELSEYRKKELQWHSSTKAMPFS